MTTLRLSTYTPTACEVPTQIFLWLDNGCGQSDYVGGASVVPGGWCAMIIADPTGSIDPRHQRRIGTFSSPADAMLALLCCEDQVLQALAMTP